MYKCSLWLIRNDRTKPSVAFSHPENTSEFRLKALFWVKFKSESEAEEVLVLYFETGGCLKKSWVKATWVFQGSLFKDWVVLALIICGCSRVDPTFCSQAFLLWSCGELLFVKSTDSKEKWMHCHILCIRATEWRNMTNWKQASPRSFDELFFSNH